MKTCIITGASDGIGKATAFDLAKSGEYDNLVLISRSLDKLNNTYFAIKEFVSVDIRPFDLCNLDEIPNLINDIFNKYKSIDCLINVAGYTDPKPLLQTTIDNLYETYTVNVFAPIILMRECARFMKQNNSFSKIISVASTAGISPRPGWLSYASSKAALISVSQTLS